MSTGQSNCEISNRGKNLHCITCTASGFCRILLRWIKYAIHLINWLNFHGVYSHYKYRFWQETLSRSVYSISSYLYSLLQFSANRWIDFDFAFNFTTSEMNCLLFVTHCMGLIMEIMPSTSSTVGILDLSLLNLMRQNLILESQHRSSACFLYFIDQCSCLLALELLWGLQGGIGVITNLICLSGK